MFPGAVISPASTASESVTLEPIITPEDEAAIAMGDAQMMDLFTTPSRARTAKVHSDVSWTSLRRTQTGRLACTILQDGSVGHCQKTLVVQGSLVDQPREVHQGLSVLWIRSGRRSWENIYL